jgi:hypothetical protein
MAFAPIAVAMVIGLLVGIVRRGKLGALARTRVRHPEVLVVALALGGVVEVTDLEWAGALTLLGLLAGLGFAMCNLHLVGMPIIAIGVVANLVPVAANGAMPVRPDALVEAEMVDAADLDRVEVSGGRELADDQTILGFLGDTIPVRWTGQVLSVGDLIMLVGLADVVTNLMLQRPSRRGRAPQPAPPTTGAPLPPLSPDPRPSTRPALT